MLRAATIAHALRGPRGLTGRAIAFVVSLMVVSVGLTGATMLFGAVHESDRRQLEITGELIRHFSASAGDRLIAGDTETIIRVVELAATRPGVRRLSVWDTQGQIVSASGGDAADVDLANGLRADITGATGMIYRRHEGRFALAVPIVRQDVQLGVVVMIWNNDAYRLAAYSALAPFLLMLACLLGAALPLTANLVKRAMAPLDELTQHAQRLAIKGEAASISLKTGDEFETLAQAFNKMTERLGQSLRQYQELAYVDPITRLPNQDRFSRELDFFILKKGGNASVVIFDLQRLPRLVQSLDPEAGREFLRVVSERLVHAMRTTSSGLQRHPDGFAPMAGRLSAAEFAVFTPNVSRTDALRVAHQINTALNHTFEWRGHKFTLGAIGGIAMAPEDGQDAAAVLRHARLALSAAQQSPGRLKLFTRSLDRLAAARLKLERDMRVALEQNEFRAYFQPKVNLANGRVEGCEALARWIRPDRTSVTPGRFIPVAEESGLIAPLSNAIMREACWKAAAWARAGHPTRVSVNISPLQFRSDRFAESVLLILRHAGLRPDLLELEITESTVMEDPERALRAIQPLRDAGVRLAIDDFGCGHSSLAALSKLPFDVMKIDQQFVRAIEKRDAQSVAIVEMILALGRALQMEIVAEGIERREEATFMAERGCHWVQGFLYGAAVPAAEFGERLRRQGTDGVAAA